MDLKAKWKPLLMLRTLHHLQSHMPKVNTPVHSFVHSFIHSFFHLWYMVVDWLEHLPYNLESMALSLLPSDGYCVGTFTLKKLHHLGFSFAKKNLGMG